MAAIAIEVPEVELRIEIPGGNAFQALSSFLVDLSNLGPVTDVEFDFKEVKFTTPAWLATVGGALRRLKADHPNAKRKAINFQHLSYAAHMGFFSYFGVTHGIGVGAAGGSDTYVPLTERHTADIRRNAALAAVPVGEQLHNDAERLATLLTRETRGDLQDALAYSIREIIRNVVEHSGAESYTFAAQYWPAASRVELVVTDQGKDSRPRSRRIQTWMSSTQRTR